ncbi:hypothetical protein VP249E411_P0103 [Vibrio phage 249E41-1]|nr:hypothetical protein VP249E411_P0103 [Vibrio phage 249E41-1]
MNKVELAKMLGLYLDTDWELVKDSLPTKHTETSSLLKMSSYSYEQYSFNNNSIVVTVEESHVNTLNYSKSKFNISDADWERYYKESFLREYVDMVWSLATEEYLGKINKIVETFR